MQLLRYAQLSPLFDAASDGAVRAGRGPRSAPRPRSGWASPPARCAASKPRSTPTPRRPREPPMRSSPPRREHRATDRFTTTLSRNRISWRRPPRVPTAGCSSLGNWSAPAMVGACGRLRGVCPPRLGRWAGFAVSGAREARRGAVRGSAGPSRQRADPCPSRGFDGPRRDAERCLGSTAGGTRKRQRRPCSARAGRHVRRLPAWRGYTAGRGRDRRPGRPGPRTHHGRGGRPGGARSRAPAPLLRRRGVRLRPRLLAGPGRRRGRPGCPGPRPGSGGRCAPAAATPRPAGRAAAAVPAQAPSPGGRRGPTALDLPAAGSADQMTPPVRVKNGRSAPTPQ